VRLAHLRWFVPVLLTVLCLLSGAAWAADEEVLREELEELRSRLFAIQQRITELEESLEEPEPSPVSPAAAREMLLPDISVIGNVVGLASSDKRRPGRNEVLLRELEIGLQGYLYPQVRADAFIALSEMHDYKAELEEGYISFLELNSVPILRGAPDGLSLRLGRKLLDFGRVNPIHPHHWDFANPPVVVHNLLGDHALIGDGAQLDYLLPIPQFANLQVGVWRAPHHHDHDDDEHSVHLGAGFEDRLYTARLWTSRPVGPDAELELGASGAWGRGEAALTHDHEEAHEDDDAEDHGRDRIRLHCLDVTYRRWPGGYRRLLLRGEALWHRRSNGEGDTRLGHYLFANYRWDQYLDAGLLYSASQRPWPAEGRDAALSAIVTNRLTETTALRLQLDRARRHETGRATELWLQVIWGIGPHSHPLE